MSKTFHPMTREQFSVISGQYSMVSGQYSMVSRSEEHTSELQSRPHLVCRLLLEKKKTRHVNWLPGSPIHRIALQPTCSLLLRQCQRDRSRVSLSAYTPSSPRHYSLLRPCTPCPSAFD